jgi:hypothetical protein
MESMLVHSWILNFVSPSIAKFTVFMENAMDVWIDLKECFTKDDFVKSQILLIDPLPPLNKIFPYDFATWGKGNFTPPDESKTLINVVDSKILILSLAIECAHNVEEQGTQLMFAT